MFEDSQLSTVLMASSSVAIGVAFLIVLLVILTVLPDCRSTLPHDMLTVYSIQFAVVLVLLFVNTITLSYALAAETSTFINMSLTNSPGYVAVFCLTVTAFLQFYLSSRRIIEYAFPFFSPKLPLRSLCFIALLSSFLLGAKRFVNISFENRSLNYRIEGLRWMYSQPSSEDNFYIAASIGFALFFLCLLYLTAAILICHKSLKKETAHQERKYLQSDLLWLLICLVSDLLFALLIMYSHFVAVPSKFLHVPVEPKFYAGLIQSYLLTVWPVITAYFAEDSLRQSLRYRTGIFMTGTPPMSPAATRRSLARNSRQHSLPIFTPVEKRDST